ncbi:MAG: serine O-acetyltransferase [Alteromonadaceae bacterium]|nr:MAG: serine O-acetyltransferase [Alteromonadaceae bacterium]
MQTDIDIPNIHAKDPVWATIRDEITAQVENEPALASFLHATILNHDTFEAALSYHLANKLANPAISALQIREIIESTFQCDCSIGASARADIKAIFDRDSACDLYAMPFLYFKGFHALQSYRVAHCLWMSGRKQLAYFLQSHISLIFSVDIHPAAQLGKGIMLDHGTGIVIGETTVIEDDVSIMQAVTLGGTGKAGGDRHPKIRKGSLVSAGAKILGNIEVGVGAKVGAGSVVLIDVPPHTTVVGVPAKIVGTPASASPALEMNHEILCDYSSDECKKPA